MSSHSPLLKKLTRRANEDWAALAATMLHESDDDAVHQLQMQMLDIKQHNQMLKMRCLLLRGAFGQMAIATGHTHSPKSVIDMAPVVHTAPLAAFAHKVLDMTPKLATMTVFPSASCPMRRSKATWVSPLGLK